MKHISRDWMLTLREIRYGPSKKKSGTVHSVFYSVEHFFQLCSCTFNVTISTYSKVDAQKKKLIQRFVSYEPTDEINFLESTLFQWRKT